MMLYTALFVSELFFFIRFFFLFFSMVWNKCCIVNLIVIIMIVFNISQYSLLIEILLGDADTIVIKFDIINIININCSNLLFKDCRLVVLFVLWWLLLLLVVVVSCVELSLDIIGLFRWWFLFFVNMCGCMTSRHTTVFKNVVL